MPHDDRHVHYQVLILQSSHLFELKLNQYRTHQLLFLHSGRGFNIGPSTGYSMNFCACFLPPKLLNSPVKITSVPGISKWLTGCDTEIFAGRETLKILV